MYVNNVSNPYFSISFQISLNFIPRVQLEAFISLIMDTSNKYGKITRYTMTYQPMLKNEKNIVKQTNSVSVIALYY